MNYFFWQNTDRYCLGDGNYNYSEFVGFLKNFDHLITLEVIDVGTDPASAIRGREDIAKLISELGADRGERPAINDVC